MSAIGERDASADGKLRTRTFSWEDPAASAAAGSGLSGLERMRAIVNGTLPPPPIARLLDFAVIEVEHGRAVFAMEPAEWMYNPIGSVHGGVAATLLDSCMGCAVHTTLPAGVGIHDDRSAGPLHPRDERCERARAGGGPRRAQGTADRDGRGSPVRRVR